MIQQICADCNNVFEYELRPGFPRKYCDTCSKIRKEKWNAKQNGQQVPAQPVPVNPVVEKPGEIAKETGTFQSTVWNHSVAANSYEFGKAGNRFKIYFETVEDRLLWDIGI